MNITPEQARALLANQSERGALWNADWNFTDRTAAIVREDSPGDEVMEIRFNGDDTAFSDGDLTLAAAAPDLAHTIAGMTQEWGVEADGNALFPVNEEWHPNGEYFTESRADAEAVRDRMAKLNPHVRYRLVRRLVGPAETIKETPND